MEIIAALIVFGGLWIVAECIEDLTKAIRETRTSNSDIRLTVRETRSVDGHPTMDTDFIDDRDYTHID